MSDALIPTDVLGEISTLDDSDFEGISSGGYLLRLELKSKGALIDTGKVKPGHYAVIKSSEDADDLGDSIDVLPIARRPKAIDMNDLDEIVVSYDRKSDLFKDIEKRSSQQNSRCQFGVSFLVVERSTGKLYEMFLGSKSNRRVVGDVSEYMALTAADIERRGLVGREPHGPLPLTLKSKRVENKKNNWSWFVMVPKPCSNAFTASQMPPLATIKEEISKFLSSEGVNGPEVQTKDEQKKSRAR